MQSFTTPLQWVLVDEGVVSARRAWHPDLCSPNCLKTWHGMLCCRSSLRTGAPARLCVASEFDGKQQTRLEDTGPMVYTQTDSHKYPYPKPCTANLLVKSGPNFKFLKVIPWNGHPKDILQLGLLRFLKVIRMELPFTEKQVPPPLQMNEEEVHVQCKQAQAPTSLRPPMGIAGCASEFFLNGLCAAFFGFKVHQEGRRIGGNCLWTTLRWCSFG